ncbi:MAG: glutathione S-transferase N-terminal domain-containing protein [Solirubrobacteraceae bacterium]
MGGYILYAMPASLYSGKARSYLRKRRIDHVERANGHPEYQQRVVPSIGRMIIPVLETPDGRLIQDTVDIIEFLEAAEPRERSIFPSTPRQRAVAHMLELFGGEGLLRPAMHFRWNFDETNQAFLAHDFGGALAAGGDQQARRAAFEMASGLMRKVAIGVGVTPGLIDQIERSYEAFLGLFSAHLRSAPYLLGGLPSNGDFGFIAPLWAHLARDPYPSQLMKSTAWPVYRWVERMNAPVEDAGEYLDYPQEFFAEDEIPATLRALLRYIAEEQLPELVAQISFIDEYLASKDDIAEGAIIAGAPSRRAIGTVSFNWRGQQMTTRVLPYRLILLQRLQAAVAERSPEEQARIRALFAECGLERLLDLRARRSVQRQSNHEVWGHEQEPAL